MMSAQLQTLSVRWSRTADQEELHVIGQGNARNSQKRQGEKKAVSSASVVRPRRILLAQPKHRASRIVLEICFKVRVSDSAHHRAGAKPAAVVHPDTCSELVVERKPRGATGGFR